MKRRGRSPRADAGPIVDDRHFIVATRDTGYRDVAAAIAELIDNSLQAEASDIRVFVAEMSDVRTNAIAKHLPPGVTMAVLDDGCGMGPETLRKALQFGGTNRFDDRSGFGRFGMGLPNSSVSQSRRLEVYSWQNDTAPYYTYLDVDEVAAGRLRSIPAPQQRPLPAWLATEVSGHGTAVLWSRCDRVGRMRAATIAQRLHSPLGRIFRYALWAGATIRVNGAKVRAIDPLFIRGNPPLNEATPYGNRLQYEFTASDTGRTSTVDVRFSELPVSRWHQWSGSLKRNSGVVGGAGVSIVRAGREIDYGWHLMGGKRRENYDDWWRCEIRFSPALDDLFGVTHSKQGISPKPELRSALAADLESIARTLNSRARASFEALKANEPTAATTLASETDRFLEMPTSVADRVDGLRYRIDVASLASPAFYATSVRSGQLTVTINADHPFYKKLYQPTCTSERARERFSIECLILAAARADVAAAPKKDQGLITTLRTTWADTLAMFLDGLSVR